MAQEKRKKFLSLPMKVLFNEEGVSFFLQSNKKLTKFKTADETEQYGIFFDTFSPASIQKLLLIHYVSYLEVGRSEFTSKRQDVMDLSKLITYGVLYRRFDEIVYSKLMDSEVVRHWNRSNPSSVIDRKTAYSEASLQASLEKAKTEVAALKQRILAGRISSIRDDGELVAEEKNLQLFLSEKLLSILRPLTWYVLVKFRTSDLLPSFLADLDALMTDYMAKTKIAEYVSLMTMELAAMAENSHIQTFAKNRYRGAVDPVSVLYDPETRKLVLEEMRLRNQNVFVGWKLGSETSTGIASRERLQVRIFNKEAAFSDLKKAVDDTLNQDVRQKSLLEFYQEAPADSADSSDLGLYYLSYLHEECQKVGILFDAQVSQTKDNASTVITMNLLV